MARKPSRGRQKIKIEKIAEKNPLQVTFSKRRSGIFKKACELYIQFGLQVAMIVLSPAGKAFSYGNSNLDALANRLFTRKPSRHPNRPCLVKARGNAGNKEQNLQHLSLSLNKVAEVTGTHRTPDVTRMNITTKETEGGRTLDIVRKSETERDDKVFYITWPSTSKMEAGIRVGQILDRTKTMGTEGEALDSRWSVGKEEMSELLWEKPIEKLDLNELEKLMKAMKELKMNVSEELKR